MRKKYLIEQCKRQIAITKDELIMFENQEDKWWIYHNKGHLNLIDDLLLMISKMPLETVNKNYIRKWLKSKIKEADITICNLDKKYNYFTNNEEMLESENELYSSKDGENCMAMTIRKILNGKKYTTSEAYSPTDWKALGLLK